MKLTDEEKALRKYYWEMAQVIAASGVVGFLLWWAFC